ncbi:MAG: hypothetical protein OXB92_00545 [Acidimicrobiaceae bacterium]|nr:hypothetical protein [Acidimicrobiia bacterium]MCY4492329.1 hypothetical protein [Acidimicrobiaceae bacterium]
MTDESTLESLREIGPIFRAREAVDVGVSWRSLYKLRDDGEVIALSRGLYQLRQAAGVDNIDFIAVCTRAPHGMICLTSALAYWDLTDEIPPAVHLATPKGSHRPAIDYPPTATHVFAAETFGIGRMEIAHSGRERFSITNRERTVVDAFRLRHLTGPKNANEALRRYLRSRPRLSTLLTTARELNVGAGFADRIRVLVP